MYIILKVLALMIKITKIQFLNVEKCPRLIVERQNKMAEISSRHYRGKYIYNI